MSKEKNKLFLILTLFIFMISGCTNELKNIEDNLYHEQLLGYKEYIKTKTNKDINLYLYSIIDGRYEKIEQCKKLLKTESFCRGSAKKVDIKFKQ